jgi:hypothetical protein
LGWGGGEAPLVILKVSKLNNFKLLLIFNYELWEDEERHIPFKESVCAFCNYGTNLTRDISNNYITVGTTKYVYV